MDATVYTQDGKKFGTMKLPESVFGVQWNADLVHQVVTAMQANARVNIAHAKDRSEVSGGGKKPWKQKGTGRARHGSSRSPIWRHGGVTHGPRNAKNYAQKINKKMRIGALYATLSRKWAEGEMLFVDAMSMKETKTKDAKAILGKLGSISGFEGVATRRNNAIYLILPKADDTVKHSFQNFGNVQVGTVAALNPLDVLQYRYVVMVKPEEIVKVIEAKAN